MESVIFKSNIFVLITNGSHKGSIGFANEIDENRLFQDIDINNSTHQIPNEWIKI
jgi:hypothetical protein